MADDSDTQQLTGIDAVAALLQRHFESRGTLVLIPDDKQSLALTAVIVGHEPRHQQLLFDVVDGQHGQELLHASRVVARGTLDDLPTWFFADGLRLREEGQDRYFVLTYPDTLYRLQRREAFRVRLPETFPASAHLKLPNSGRPLKCWVWDVSVTGVGLMMSDQDAGSLPEGALVSELVLVLEGQPDLVIDAQVRNLRHVGPADITLVGLEFVGLLHRQEQLLQRFLMQRQRERLHER